jgi:hypothetical protein
MRSAAVVVNYNGGDDLPRCLAALAGQTETVEIVLVDCGSSDGSRRLAEDPPAGVHAVPLARNLGYSGGCSAGLAASAPEAEIVGFFNPDCFARADYFGTCRRIFEEHGDVGGVAGRLERPDGVQLDSCGQVLTPLLLRVRDRGYGEAAAGAFTAPARVLAACGAGMVYRRAALVQVAVDGEVFPGEYFAFWEDLDLGWRVSNAGWRVVYEPGAVAVHRRAATAAAGGGRLMFRRPSELAATMVVNRWATLLRNLHPVDFWLRAPVLVPGELAMLALILLRRPAVLRGLLTSGARLRRAARQRAMLPRRRLAELL